MIACEYFCIEDSAKILNLKQITEKINFLR